MTAQIDPISRMIEIAEFFLYRAKELDLRVETAINSDASQSDIVSLMNLSAVDRMRALTAYGQCAPYCRPRLAAVEVAPASQSTIDRFEQRISRMSEEQITSHLKQIAAGGSALQLLESADDD